VTKVAWPSVCLVTCSASSDMARVCVVTFKECWQANDGAWYSSGGFPIQMAAIASLFDEMTLVIVQVEPRAGGVALPSQARVIGLASPVGLDLRRKLSVVARLPYYLARISREIRVADAVHTPLPGDLALLGFLTALALRKPLLARYGGSWSLTGETTVMNRITRQCMRFAAGGRNVMLATGAGREPPARGMTWIFASAISQREIAVIQPDLDRPGGTPLRLIYAGRLSPEKGIQDLIEAMALLGAGQAKGARLPRLTVVGDGPQRDDLVRQVERSQCGDLVHFTGQLAREDLLAELCRSDVCVLPSLSESFCKARLDAMLCGVPVMTTDVGFGRDIVGADGERGWLVPSGRASRLASALRRVNEHRPDWPALRRRCRAFAETLTVDAWTATIGQACAERWKVPFIEGKLQL
jgi:glycosyltransferase involved in cell wall biosynthesis